MIVNIIEEWYKRYLKLNYVKPSCAQSTESPKPLCRKGFHSIVLGPSRIQPLLQLLQQQPPVVPEAVRSSFSLHSPLIVMGNPTIYEGFRRLQCERIFEQHE